MFASALDRDGNVTCRPIPFYERSCCLLRRLGTEETNVRKLFFLMKRTYRLDIAFLKAIDLEIVGEVTRLVERGQRLMESLVLWIILRFQAFHSLFQVYLLGFSISSMSELLPKIWKFNLLIALSINCLTNDVSFYFSVHFVFSIKINK